MVQIRVDKYNTIESIEARMDYITDKIENLSAEYVILEEKYYELKKPGFKIPNGGFKNDKQSKKSCKNSSSTKGAKQKTAATAKEKEKIT